MQAAHYAVAGATLVILDEVRGSYEFSEALFAERLEEIATLITEETWLEDDDLGDRSGDKLHSCAVLLHIGDAKQVLSVLVLRHRSSTLDKVFT